MEDGCSALRAGSTGPAMATPTPSTRVASTPASVSACSTRRAARSIDSAGVVVDVGELRRLGEHRAAEVGDGDADAVVVEVDADGGARGAVEAEHRRRPALGGRRVVVVGALDDEAALDEVADEGGDRGAAQAGAARDLGPAQPACAAQRIDHPQAVELAQ